MICADLRDSSNKLLKPRRLRSQNLAVAVAFALYPLLPFCLPLSPSIPLCLLLLSSTFECLCRSGALSLSISLQGQAGPWRSIKVLSERQYTLVQKYFSSGPGFGPQ